MAGPPALGEVGHSRRRPRRGKIPGNPRFVRPVKHRPAVPDGSPGPGPCNSLVLDGDDGGDDTIRPRLQALGADLERVFVLDRATLDGEPRCFPELIDVLEQALARTGARLLVI